MTQKQLILAYVQEFNSIVPAKKYGFIYRSQMMGSELSRRCRELRAEGKLTSQGKGKFTEYFLPNKEGSMDGYQKFQQMGQWLKKGGEKPKAPAYTQMPYDELLRRKETAELWLKDHTSDPNYKIAMERYEKICDEINLVSGESVKNALI